MLRHAAGSVADHAKASAPDHEGIAVECAKAITQYKAGSPLVHVSLGPRKGKDPRQGSHTPDKKHLTHAVSHSVGCSTGHFVLSERGLIRLYYDSGIYRKVSKCLGADDCTIQYGMMSMFWLGGKLIANSEHRTVVAAFDRLAKFA